jgi:adenosylcobyric acid synthase
VTTGVGRGALLVAGTTSDAGKSTVVAALCRWLRRQGVRVAPFKAQNMSNNSTVTPDGGEIGRAQALQAVACGLEPSVRFNPVLLKPGAGATSQVVLLGQPVGDTGALDYPRLRAELADAVFDTLAALRSEYDVVVCEGAGSPAEINLRAGDLANMGLARAANLPTLLVGDIDRGGVLAAMHGTLALLAPADQALVCGFVVNKFRGDRRALKPGLDMLTAMTGRPVYGVLPYLPDLSLDAEDSLSYPDGRLLGRPAPPRGSQPLRVAAVRLPRMSNATDLEALAAEPGVHVRLTTSPADVADADLVVLPGTRATVSDLAWLRDRGLADAIVAHAAAGRPVLGICGGYQMLAATIDDRVESGRGTVAGLDLLPVAVTFAPEKTLARPTGTGFGAPVSGYEIHHGRAVVRSGAAPFFTLAGGGAEGCRAGPVFGTQWHGAFEHDEFRRRFLAEVAGLAGCTGFVVAADTDFRRRREQNLDLLADTIAEHLDTAAVLDLVTHGAPAGLRTILPAGPPAELPPAGSGSRGALRSLLTILAGTDDVSNRPTEPPPARPAESPVEGRRRVDSFAALAERTLASPPCLGPVRLVAVDGRAGSGKTTFANRLADAFTAHGGNTAVLHTDEILQGWLDMVTFWPRLEEWVLGPLRHGRPATFRRYDWPAGRFEDARQHLGVPDVLVIEGVTTARATVRAELTLSVYVHTGRQRRFERGIQRDGPAVLPHWARWMSDEDAHFAADRTVERVGVVVDGDPVVPHDPAAEYVRIVPHPHPGDP